MTSHDRRTSETADEETSGTPGGTGAAHAPDNSGWASWRAGRAERREERHAGRKHLPIWQESILLLGVALVLAIVIKAFFVQAFWIPSESMEPGLVFNDRILVQKWSYWSGDPERGDVVVFEDPGGWLSAGETQEPGPVQTVLEKVGLYPSGGHLVKRVIGVEGDTVKCCDRRGRILVNGVALDEGDYVRNEERCNGPMPAGCAGNWTAGPVPEGHLFVMGDHRDQSADSSFRLCKPQQVGCLAGREFVPADLVVGKVFLLVWPQDRFGRVTRPATFEELPEPDAG